MSSAGQLDKRFFWEHRGGRQLIYDRAVGRETPVAEAITFATAEEICALLNKAVGPWRSS